MPLNTAITTSSPRERSSDVRMERYRARAEAALSSAQRRECDDSRTINRSGTDNRRIIAHSS